AMGDVDAGVDHGPDDPVTARPVAAGGRIDLQGGDRGVDVRHRLEVRPDPEDGARTRALGVAEPLNLVLGQDTAHVTPADRDGRRHILAVERRLEDLAEASTRRPNTVR